MQTLSIISFVTNKLDEFTEVLRKIFTSSGISTGLGAGLTIGVFVLGCLMISFFANK